MKPKMPSSVPTSSVPTAAGASKGAAKPVVKTKPVAAVLPPKPVGKVAPPKPMPNNKLPPNTRHKAGKRGMK